jgi:hypothetical protein
MNCNCPKCGSQDTQKLTLAMNQGGLMEKAAKFGIVYVYNIWIPVVAILFGVLFGIVFAMLNGYLGFLVFVGILYAGYLARAWVKAKSKSKYSELPAEIRQNGFQCQRCENTFLPAT